MKYLFIPIFAAIEILLIIYYCMYLWNIFLIAAIVYLIILLLIWWADSKITTEWHQYNSNSLEFAPHIFSQTVSFYFICDYFERVKSESRIHKIVGLSKGWHHRNSVRIGFRRDGDTLKPVLYLYTSKKRVSINMGVTFQEGDLMFVEFRNENGILKTRIHNCTTDVYQYSIHPIGFNFGLGYYLFPSGCKSIFRIRR